MFARFPYHPATNQAADIIIENHSQGAWPGPYCLFLGARPSPAALKVLEAALEKNKSKETQGYARYGLAKYYQNQADSADPENLGVRQRFIDKAEKLLAEVVEKYADLDLNGEKIGKKAASQLFELRHLSVGKVAPEIEGEDIDGKKFKLSDYRGKIVLLDFWGHW